MSNGTARLGGEFNPQDGVPVRYDYDTRERFLEAIRKNAPLVLQTLREEVLPLYSVAAGPPEEEVRYYCAYREEYVQRTMGTRTLRFEELKEAIEQPEDRAALLRELLQWVERFSLHTRTDWVLQAAFDTLSMWHTDGSREHWRLFGIPWRLVSPKPGADLARYPLDKASQALVDRAVGTGPDRQRLEELFGTADVSFVVQEHDPGPFRFGFNGWISYGEQRAEYESHVRRAFEEQLKEYLDRVEEESTARGWHRVPAPRSGVSNPEDAYSMLAKWQCGAVQTKKQLINLYGLKKSKERDYHSAYERLDYRLTQAARAIQIELRPGRRGRPRRK